MKTTATQQVYRSVLQMTDRDKNLNQTSRLRIVYKSDLNNHRFALHDNKTVQDANSWDQSWFANYE